MLGNYHHSGRNAFWQAVQEASRNFGFERIEFLSSELEALGHAFEQDNLGLSIKGHWIEQNLSYVATVAQMVDGHPKALLTMQMSPLSLKTAHVLFAHDQVRSHKTYRHMDTESAADRMTHDIRRHILQSVPSHLNAAVDDILYNRREIDVPADYIGTKFAGPSGNPDEARVAYELALAVK